MKQRPLVVLLLGALTLTLLFLADPGPVFSVGARPGGSDSEIDRSPVDLALSPDGQWLVTANQSSGSASLVRTADLAVVAEVEVGQHPAAVVVCPDGNSVLMTATHSGELVRLRIAGDQLVREQTIQIGFHPHGVAVSPDGRFAYVALTAADQVAIVDLGVSEVIAKISVGRWPRSVALSPDGSRLAVSTSGGGSVTVLDPATRTVVYENSFSGMNIGQLKCSQDGEYAYFPWMMYRKNVITPENIRLGWVLASRIARVRLDGKSRREAMSLDPRGQAIADPHGLDITSDESRMVVSASGTHELLVYRMAGLPLKDYGVDNHVDRRLLADNQRFYRIPLGGRPMGVRISPDNHTVYVANAISNSVQAVDIDQRAIIATAALGGPSQPSLARRGEAIFYDATYSLDQWYSCHSCHFEGGPNSQRIDTMNDGTRATFKTVLPLHNLTHTGPWTWHGWQTDLDEAMHKSITSTMQGKAPTGDDVAALVAYFGTLQPPPNPYRSAPAAPVDAIERGRRIFESAEAACIECHSGPFHTDGMIHDVGLGSERDQYEGFNTPSLVGVYLRARFLHDGRGTSLKHILEDAHSPEKVSGSKPLDPAQLDDLIEFLKTL